MRSPLERIQQIEAYVLGTLNTEQKLAFEREMAADAVLRSEMENQQLLVMAVRRKTLRSEIIRASGSGGGWTWMLLSAVAVIGIAAAIFALSSPEVRQNVQEAVKQTAFLVSAENEAVSSRPVFAGVEMWTEPEVQHFAAMAEKGATIEGKDGTLIIFPTNAFTDSAGHAVRGQVDIELVEALTLDKMVLYNLTTMAGTKPLQTGGMFYINASQDGKNLLVNPERPMLVQVPTAEVKEGMMAFRGEVVDGSVNWKDPQPLQRFLVPVDFETLDFLPAGFENAVYALPNISRYYATEKPAVDSVYYSLGKPEKENREPMEIVKFIGATAITQSFLRQSETMYLVDQDSAVSSFREDSAGDTVSESLICGIEPLTIQSIRTAPFAKTFLATKEFETRVRAMHTLKRGQEVIDLYVKNLEKPLHEVDAMAAALLEGGEKEKFQAFADEKLTNIKDINIYQERLTTYYNKKKREYAKTLALKKAQIRQQSDMALNRKLNELSAALQKGLSASTDNTIPVSVFPAASLPPPSAATAPTYSFQWFSFGWANIDMYLKLLEGSSRVIPIAATSDVEDVSIYQWINTLNTLTPLTLKEDGTAEARFPQLGAEGWNKMKETYSIGIGRDGDVFYWALQRFNPYETHGVDLDLVEKPLDEIKATLAGLSENNKPLIDRLRTEEEEIIELQHQRQEQEKQMEKYREELKRYNEAVSHVLAEQRAKMEADNKDRSSLLAVMSPCEPSQIFDEDGSTMELFE